MKTEELLRHRMLKFRKLGGFQEGVPVDPKKKVNMKKKDELIVGKSTKLELEGEVEKLKKQILKAKESSVRPPVLAVDEMIEKLKKEVDHEYSEAIKAMGLKDRLTMLRDEFAKVTSENHLMHPVLMDKIEKLKDEFNRGLTAAPNYENLAHKLDMLKELSKAKRLSENDSKAIKLKQEINKKFKEVVDRSDLKEKMEALKAEIRDSGASNFGDLEEELKDKILRTKWEVEAEMTNVLRSMGLEVEGVKSKLSDLVEQSPSSGLRVKMEHLNEEISQKIQDVVSSSDLKNMVELLKLEIAKAGKTPDTTSKNKIEALEQQIKQRLLEAISSSDLKDKHEELQAVVSEDLASLVGSDGSLKREEDGSKNEQPRVEINLGANRSFA